jgi:type I restriction enzyme S subunit
MDASAQLLNARTTSPLGEVVDINPRPGNGELADDSLASFIPMKCVEEESGRFEPLGDRKVAEVRKGYTPFRDGDVIFAKVTPCMENGKAAVMKGLTNGVGFGSTEFFTLRPSARVDANYLLHFLLQRSFRQQAARNMTGAVGLRRVPKAYLEQQPIPLPPIDEQRRIVAEIEKQFTRLDAGRASLGRVQIALKRYRASVLKAACEGRLVPTGAELARQENRNYETGEQLLQHILTERHDWFRAKQEGTKTKKEYAEPARSESSKLPLLPEGWTWGTWDQLSNWVTYGFTRPMPHVEHGIPIITAKGVNRGRIDFDGAHVTTSDAYYKLSAKDRPQRRDILITKDGTIGRAAVVDTTRQFCINQSVAVIWLRSCAMDRQFLLAVIESELTQKPIWAKARGVAIQHLSITDFAKMAVPIPPLAEQQRIVAEVGRRLSLAEELERVVEVNLVRATRLRQCMLERAFNNPAHCASRPSMNDKPQ